MFDILLLKYVELTQHFILVIYLSNYVYLGDGICFTYILFHLQCSITYTLPILDLFVA